MQSFGIFFLVVLIKYKNYWTNSRGIYVLRCYDARHVLIGGYMDVV